MRGAGGPPEPGEEGEPGINGAIKRRSPGGPPTIVTVEVPSVDASLLKITRAGGKVLMGKTAIPGVGYRAYCQDTEGTIFGLMETDERAQQ